MRLRHCRIVLLPLSLVLYLMRTSTLFLLIPLLSSAVEASDRMCEKLDVFTQSVNSTAPLSVTLKNDWKTFSQSCTHNQQQSEINFCSWLLENTSKEFMHLNVQRIKSCSTQQEVSISYSYGVETTEPFLKVVVLNSAE